MGSRTWIKIYCDRWLNGTIREETPEIRGIWVDLLVLAGSGKYGDSGEIKITDEVGYSDSQLADLLQISRQKWATIKKRLIETERVMVRNLNQNRGGITRNSNIIVIKNWAKYQSEYERQRIYRQSQDTSNPLSENSNQRLQPKVTSKGAARDRDKRLEKENREGEGSCSFSQKSEEEVIDAYEENIGFVSEEMEAEIKLAVIKFTADWVFDAIKEACLRNKLTWIYIAGILKNWQRYGRSDMDKEKASAAMRILEAVKDGAMTSTELTDSLDLARNTVDAAVSRLRKARRIMDTGGKKWGLTEVEF